MQDEWMDRIAALEKRVEELEAGRAAVENVETLSFNAIEVRELRLVSDIGEPLILIGMDPEDPENGFIKVFDKQTGKELVVIFADEDGGGVTVRSNRQIDPAFPDFSAQMVTDQNGNGQVSVCDANGDDRVALRVAPSHLGGVGRLVIHGTVDNHERVVVGCNPETDSGTVKTYDITGKERCSLEEEPGDIRVIHRLNGDISDLENYHYMLKTVEGMLENETDSDQKRFLNVKREAISAIISEISA